MQYFHGDHHEAVADWTVGLTHTGNCVSQSICSLTSRCKCQSASMVFGLLVCRHSRADDQQSRLLLTRDAYHDMPLCCNSTRSSLSTVIDPLLNKKDEIKRKMKKNNAED